MITFAEARSLYRWGNPIYPTTGTHKLHLRPVEEQRGTGYHEEERDPVPASSPGPRDHKKGPPPLVHWGRDYVRDKYACCQNTHNAVDPFKSKPEETVSRCSMKDLDGETVVRQ